MTVGLGAYLRQGQPSLILQHLGQIEPYVSALTRPYRLHTEAVARFWQLAHDTKTDSSPGNYVGCLSHLALCNVHTPRRGSILREISRLTLRSRLGDVQGAVGETFVHIAILHSRHKTD